MTAFLLLMMPIILRFGCGIEQQDNLDCVAQALIFECQLVEAILDLLLILESGELNQPGANLMVHKWWASIRRLRRLVDVIFLLSFLVDML